MSVGMGGGWGIIHQTLGIPTLEKQIYEEEAAKEQ